MEKQIRYFDKHFVISAKKNKKRRRYITTLFQHLNLDFEFFDAVMGNDLKKEEIDAVYDESRAITHKTIKRPLSKPEIGCALSHIGIYKKIISDNLRHAFIFEDDINPVKNNLNKIRDTIQELPDNWDLIHFGTLNHYAKAPLLFKLKLIFYYPFITTFLPGKIKYKYRHLWNMYPRNYSKSLKRAGYHQGTQAYAISRSGAEKFLNYHDKIVTPLDYMISVMVVENELNAFMTKEIMFDQNEKFDSSIESSRLALRGATSG